jgi:hypothetical protein
MAEKLVKFKEFLESQPPGSFRFVADATRAEAGDLYLIQQPIIEIHCIAE